LRPLETPSTAVEMLAAGPVPGAGGAD
jgi:hypothetical protein